MRVKTEEKRQEILAIATKAFREKGYSDTSMAEISSRVGGSKSTLYNYFSSKEELFVSVMLEMASRSARPMIEKLERSTNIEQGLEQFIYESMRLLCTAELIDFRRMLISEGNHPQLGKLIHEQGAKRHMQSFADFYTTHMKSGFFRKADPWRAAIHMNSLCYGSPVEQVLEGVIKRPTKKELEIAAHEAADFFLRAYKAAP